MHEVEEAALRLALALNWGTIGAEGKGRSAAGEPIPWSVWGRPGFPDFRIYF